MDSRTPRAAAYALQDTANLGLFAPPPISRPVRKLPSVRHTPGPAAMLTKSPKFTYRLAGHTLPLGAMFLKREYKCGGLSFFTIGSPYRRFFYTRMARKQLFLPITLSLEGSLAGSQKTSDFLSSGFRLQPWQTQYPPQTVGKFCPLWEYSDSHGSMFERSEFAYGTVHRRRTRRGKIRRV